MSEDADLLLHDEVCFRDILDNSASVSEAKDWIARWLVRCRILYELKSIELMPALYTLTRQFL